MWSGSSATWESPKTRQLENSMRRCRSCSLRRRVNILNKTGSRSDGDYILSISLRKGRCFVPCGTQIALACFSSMSSTKWTRSLKHRLSIAVVPVLDSAGIFITSLEPGLTWTIANDRRQLRNWLGGPHPQVGRRVFGPGARVGRSHQNEQLPETAAMASTMTAMRALTGTEFATKLRGWHR